MDWEKITNKIIEVSFYLILIIVPLILTPYNFELFEFNKMLTVYFFTIIITAAWIIQSIFKKQFVFKKSPFLIPLALFFSSQLLSTLFSIEPHTSLWGYYSRFHGGLFSTICYLLLYLAYTTFMADKTKASLSVIFTTALVVSSYGILEHLGIDKNLWVQDVQNRVFSTLGQPNWLAAYLISLIPVSLALFLKSKTKPAGLYYLFLTANFFLTLLYTKSRSGLLGLAIGLLIFALLYLIKYFKKLNFKKLILSGSILLLITLITGTDYTPKLADLLSPASSTPSSTTNYNDLGPPTVAAGGSSSADIRKVVWQGALAVWRHYPIFGSGVETFAYSYYNFRPSAHNLLSEWDFLYNKAHNEFLNFLATTGILGLFSYCLIIIWFVVYTLKQFKKAQTGNQSLLLIGLISGYLALAVSNFFGFSVVPVALFFFLFPAFVFTLVKTPKPPSNHQSPKYYQLSNPDYAFITITIFAGLFLLAKVLIIWQADKVFALGKNQVKQNLVQEGFLNLQKAVQLSPHEPLFLNELSETKAKMAVIYNQETATQAAAIRDQFINQAIAESDQVISQNPVHLSFYKSRIKTFLLLATIDPQYTQSALEATYKAIELSPTDAKLYYNLALIYQQINQTQLAQQALIKTIGLKPDYEAARYALGSLYQQTSQPDLARQQYQYILDYLNPQNQLVIKNLKEL